MTTCPACAEAVAPGMTRCPHCGESFVLPPLARPVAGPPQALRVLAWSLLVLACLRLTSFVHLAVVFLQFGLSGAMTWVPVFGAQLGHTALVAAAGVGLLQARSWGPIVAWLQVAATAVSLGWFVLSFLGVGLGGGYLGVDLGSLTFVVSLVVAVMTAVVLARPDVRAALRPPG